MESISLNFIKIRKGKEKVNYNFSWFFLIFPEFIWIYLNIW